MIDKGNGDRIATAALALAAVFALTTGVVCPEPARAAERIGGDFALERVDLRFVGGAKVMVLPAGQEARAEVEITFKGSGQLGGAWEIAEPTTTSGSPRFRTLELVNRLLGMGRREVLVSPPLPTAEVGPHVLRLRITQPEQGGQPLTLKYFVGQDGDGAVGEKAAPPATIATRAPVPGTPAEGLKFSWQPVTGSIAYQLDFYEKEGGAPPAAEEAEDSSHGCLVDHPSPLGRPPVTGLMIPGSKTEASLGQLAAKKLAVGRTYLWRVVAIGKDGSVLCESALQEFVR